MGLVTLASHITLQSRLRRFWSETLSIVSRFWGPQVENGHARTHSAVAGLHRRDPTAQRGGGLLERAGEGICSSWAKAPPPALPQPPPPLRSEEHTPELHSLAHLVCPLLL